jgi:LacI family transcriptional regulator
MSREITLRRIAREAGVSIATASRAIRQPDLVSPETRDRILSLVRSYGYVPDAIAASFSSRRSGVVGLVIPTLSNSIYAAFAQALQSVLQASGRRLLIASTGYSKELERDIVLKLVESRAEAVVFTGYEREPDVYGVLRRYEIPFVVSWAVSSDPDIPSISFDNHEAAKGAVERLIGLGHRRIGLMCGITAVNDRAAARLAGYRAALKAHDINFDTQLVRECNFDASEGAVGLEQLVVSSPRPTAIFCANDVLAMGALFACQRLGLEVPRDLSIVGFDDLPITATTWPSLSTVRVPAVEMGRMVGDAILQAVDAGRPIQSRVVATSFVARASSGRCEA